MRLVRAAAAAVVIALLGLLVWDVSHSGHSGVASKVDKGDTVAAPKTAMPFFGDPGTFDLAAYRVVQEALTNALKYAGPAHAWVAVHWVEDALELEIANDGRGDGDGTGGGHGLAGMRERVSLYGGVIESGPRDGGGYVVRARLPLEEAA